MSTTLNMVAIFLCVALAAFYLRDFEFDIVPPNWLLNHVLLPPSQREKFDRINKQIHGKVKFYDKPSKIHGRGCYASELIKKGEKVGTILNEFEGYLYVPPDIYFVNHCSKSNTEMKKTSVGKFTFDLFATRDIEVDQEIVLNYYHTPKYIKKPDPDWVDSC